MIRVIKLIKGMNAIKRILMGETVMRVKLVRGIDMGDTEERGG